MNSLGGNDASAAGVKESVRCSAFRGWGETKGRRGRGKRFPGAALGLGCKGGAGAGNMV